MVLLVVGSVPDQDLRPIVICIAISPTGPNIIYWIIRVIFIWKGSVHIPTDTLYLFITVNRCQSGIGVGLVISRGPRHRIHKAGYSDRGVHGKVVIVFYIYFALLTFLGRNKLDAKGSPRSINC